MIPFAAPASAYAFLLSGERHPAASVFLDHGKECARTRIWRPDGELTLSVPVEGGVSVLKRRNIPDVTISQHGRWQDVHLGAWRAFYGKTPFFIHLFPYIEEIYATRSHGTLNDFNRAFHDLALSWLGGEEAAESVRNALAEGNKAVESIVGEYREKLNYDFSIFDSLFRYGRNTIFGISTD